MAVKGSCREELVNCKKLSCSSNRRRDLRVACFRLTENNIKLIALIHDAVIIECEEETADEGILKAQKIMSDAAEVVLGLGNRLKTEAEITLPGQIHS
jgi:hypothetical protein